jgi:hypothetical protein
MKKDERLAWTQELLRDFERSRNKTDAHRIRLFREIQRIQFGQTAPYLSPEIAFKFLACRSLYFRYQCSVDPSHYSGAQPWQYCGLRFFCDGCACYERRHRAGEWGELIKWVASASRQYPEQAVMLEWDLPDAEDARWLSRFSDYLNRVWQRALVRSGISPTWMLMVAVDPVTAIVRALYLGPSAAPVIKIANRNSTNAPLIRIEERGEIVAPINPSGNVLLATSGAWKPRLVNSISFFGESDGNCADLWSALPRALRWVTDSPWKPSNLEPSLAIALDRTYYRRRLYSVHGLLLGVKGIAKNDLDAGRRRSNRFYNACPVCKARLQMRCERPVHH